MVLTDYQIQANTRRCAVTGRDLAPGEKFYTALFDEEGRFVRRDFCEESWHGAPEGAFSFWSGLIPPTHETGRPKIDDDQLMDCFLRLEGQMEPSRLRFRYVVALLLMRRKRLRFEEAQANDSGEVLKLRCSRTRQVYDVINPRLTEQDIAVVQREVLQALGWE